MKLYSYFRSSASYRVRIALNLKGLSADIIPVNLVKSEQKDADYTAKNPQGLVPSLEIDSTAGSMVLAQSLAIIEYLDELDSSVPLLPSDRDGRAIVRSLSQLIACEIHPLNNLRVLKYLTGELGVDEATKNAWYAHWIHEGFRALEAELNKHAGQFCYGDTPTMADCCLVPQVFNAKRFEVDLSAYPTINRIVTNCQSLDAFIQAAPANQPDAPSA